MEPDSAELSSVATSLEDLSSRLAHLAEGYLEIGDDTAAADLFEVERALQMGQRRLEQLIRRQP
jgi:hypothetical protein